MNGRELEIILVEDDEHDAELAMRSLKKHHLTDGLLHFSDGEAVLDFLLGRTVAKGGTVDESPKVVFLDLKLPKVDGFEVLKALRADERTRLLPVVILTSSTDEKDVAETYRLGANSYVVKPVDFDKFMAAVGDLGIYWARINETPTSLLRNGR